MMMNNKKLMEFSGNKIKLPWKEWGTVEISPEGIHTSKGLIKISELELLKWKANFYDRANRVIAYEIMDLPKQEL